MSHQLLPYNSLKDLNAIIFNIETTFENNSGNKQNGIVPGAYFRWRHQIFVIYNASMSSLAALTHYSSVLLLYTPLKYQKTFRFLGGIEKHHRAVMG